MNKHSQFIATISCIKTENKEGVTQMIIYTCIPETVIEDAEISVKVFVKNNFKCDSQP